MIENFYNGILIPIENFGSNNSTNYQILSKQVQEREKELLETLSKEQMNLYQKIKNASEMPVFSRKYTNKRTGSNFTWAGVDEKSFRIAFSASEQGTKNGQEVLKVMKSKPWIIWLQPGVWLAISTAILILNIFLYNAVSSLFASMGTGTEIAELRVIVFYTPCVLALVCPVLSFIFVIVRDNILYECAVKLANEIEADLIAKAGSPMKCYRNVCPNCGAVSTSSLKRCNSCGISLEVLDSAMGLGTLKFYRDDD